MKTQADKADGSKFPGFQLSARYHYRISSSGPDSPRERFDRPSYTPRPLPDFSQSSENSHRSAIWEDFERSQRSRESDNWAQDHLSPRVLFQGEYFMSRNAIFAWQQSCPCVSYH